MRRGTRVGQAYVALTVDGDGSNEEIVREVEDSEDGVADSGERSGRGWRERFSREAFSDKLDEVRDKAAERLRERFGTAGDDSGHDFSARLSESLRDGLGDDGLLDRIGDRMGENFSKHLIAGLERRLAGGQGVNTPLGALFDKLVVSSGGDAERAGERLGDRFGRGMGNGVSRNKTFGDRIGGLLGAGARNNFINIIGRSVGGLVNIMESFSRASFRAFSTFSKGAASAGEDASVFARFMAGAGAAGSEALAGLIASGPAAAAAIIVAAVAASVLVSVLNALLAIVVALAATIASALVGALAVGTAAFAALGGAVGLGVLAFMSMTDAQQDMLSAAMRPLHQEAIGLGQTMLTQLVPAFGDWARNLQIALAYAAPLAAVMGGALADAGRIFTASLSGTGVQMFITALAVTLPAVITNLSSALGGFINGASGLFAGLMPFVVQFSDYLNRTAQTFAAWATSAAGQNAISDFVARALTSLASLWNFVKAVGSLLVEVFFSDESQKAGNNIFDRMADAVRRFTAYLKKDNNLEKWLAEGVAFSYALADSIKTVGQILQDLNESGVIDGIAAIAQAGADAYSTFSRLPGALQDILFPLKGVADLIGYIGSALGSIGIGTGSVPATEPSATNLANLLSGTTPGTDPYPGSTVPTVTLPPDIQALIDQLTDSGAEALAATSTTSGGYLPVPKPPKAPDYVNPYIEFANSLIDKAPGLKQIIRKAMRTLNRAVKDAISEAVTASGADTVHDAFSAQAEALKAQGTSLVEGAQSALENAARTLAGASNKKDAKRALKDVKALQAELLVAQAAQVRLNNAAKILSDQQISTTANVSALLSGISVYNATLADYAEARKQLAIKLEDANKKLTDAIALRDTYSKTVSDAAKSFASILSASAKTIDGIQQALTADDITTNLQDRLAKLKAFQDGLRILLSRGLSNDAYKQLVDAGAEQGGAYVQALLSGGQGAVQQTNALVAQIGAISDQLGLETSSRLYQAGVDAAQGLVDGLTSLSGQLDSAAVALGTSIAAAIARALGIASPSTVMYDYMYSGVGDGLVGGLDAAGGKVGRAASRLSARVAVSPSLVAAYSEGRVPSGVGGGAVSGNQPDPRFRDLIVHTPTEDPVAVAHEVLNEVTGRLP